MKYTHLIVDEDGGISGTNDKDLVTMIEEAEDGNLVFKAEDIAETTLTASDYHEDE